MKKLVHRRKLKILRLSDIEDLVENLRKNRESKKDSNYTKRNEVLSKLNDKIVTQSKLEIHKENKKLIEMYLASLLEEDVSHKDKLLKINSKIDFMIEQELNKEEFSVVNKEILTLKKEYPFFCYLTISKLLQVKFNKDLSSLENKGAVSLLKRRKEEVVGDDEGIIPNDIDNLKYSVRYVNTQCKSIGLLITYISKVTSLFNSNYKKYKSINQNQHK